MSPSKDIDVDAPQEVELTGYAKYAHLRANVARRRAAYKWFIFLAILVFVGSIADILWNESGLEMVVYAALAILFLWALILLFSRKRAQEEAEQLAMMEKALLQCPDCKNIFQYGEARFTDRKKVAFSCPICGAYSALPDPTAAPVKAVVPQGDLREIAYRCNHCEEDIRVGTFGEQPLHDVRFRKCPHCGEKGHIVRIGVEVTPQAAPPAEGGEAWGAA